MSDDAATGTPAAPGSVEALRKYGIKPGEVRNPKGINGPKKYQAKVAAFYAEVAEAGGDKTRFERILLATYTSALVPGPKGAMDRKLIWEQCAGKAKQQVDITSEDGTLRPALIRFEFMPPPEGDSPGQ